MRNEYKLKIECIITDLHLLQPTKQFKNSVKETYNCKLIISNIDKPQMDELNTAINETKTMGLNGCWQNIETYPKNMIYPTKNEKLTTNIVACTFFKPKICDMENNELTTEQIQDLEQLGSFYGFVDLSFYPYAKNTSYGIGTNLNGICYIGKEKPFIAPFDDEIKANIEQEQEQTIMETKTITIEKIINGISYTFIFDLFTGGANANQYIIIQNKNKPTIFNVGIYDAQSFTEIHFDSMIKYIFMKLNKNDLWNNQPLGNGEISQMINYAIGKMEIMEKQPCTQI